jgi:asparagine synthase (glutamine-hydrolysing)
VRKIGLVEHLAAWGAHGAWPAQEDGRAIQAYYLHNRRARTLEGNIGISTLFGIRLSDPLADRALTEFCLAIPREQYVLGGRDRALARRVSAGLLPESVLNEKLWGKHNIEWFDRICPQRAEFAAELETLERVPLAAEMLDLPRLKALVDNWPADGAAANVNRLDYEYFLTRAIHMGRFIRWLDGGNQGAEG